MSKRKRAGAGDGAPHIGGKFRSNKVARLGNHQVTAPSRQRTVFDDRGTAQSYVERSRRLDFDQYNDDYSDHDDEDRDEVIHEGRNRRGVPLRSLPKIRKEPTITTVIPEFRRRATTRTMFPWVRSTPADDSSDARWRLHVEIEQFYDFARPQEFEKRVRDWVVSQVKYLVTARGANVQILPFGSFATNLNLPTGDLDLVLVESFYKNFDQVAPAGKAQMRSALNKYSGLMRGSTFDIVNIIRHSRIPLAKYRERSTRIDVDLSFNNMGGIPAINTVQTWMREYKAMPPLVMVIKQLLLMNDLNDVAYQGMGSFTIICLVTSYLMQLSEADKLTDQSTDRRLSDLLLGFFDLYGSKFNRNQVAILMEQDRSTYFPKPGNERGNGKFHIVDPNNPPRDIASGTYRATDIAELFRDAKDKLERALQAHESAGKGNGPVSLLDCIIGGDYQIYFKQRDHMRQVASNIEAAQRASNGGGTRRRPS